MKNKKLPLLILSLATVGGQLFSQIPDSLAKPQYLTPVLDTLPAEISAEGLLVDSVAPATTKRGFIKKIFDNSDYPNPKKALYFSLAVPGAGQFYNKRWWKLPFVYGGYALLIMAVDYNTGGYKLYRDAYIAELAGEEHPLSNSGLSANDMRRFRDRLDKNRQLSYIGLFAMHLVQTAEAFVDSHLKTFDVSDDLSFKIRPTVGTAGPGGGSYVGIGLSFQLSP